MTIPEPAEQFESGITVSRYGAATKTDGVWVAATPTTFTMVASMQPMEGDELLMVPEGDREREHITIFTDTLLRTIDQEALTGADVVTWNGNDYEVKKVRNYRMGALDHYECIASRVNP